MKSRLVLLLASLLQVHLIATELIESCDSKIYCQGVLLDTIQRARLFNDSKSFVDLNLKNSPDDTLEIFDNLMKNTSNNPSRDQLREFVDENFDNTTELENWTPSDFNSNPPFLNKIEDAEIKEFAKNLIAIWPTLGRQVKQEVFENPEKHSLIPLPNGFIVPGGRFSEIYYWDSYWIIKGLLLSDMKDTVKGILENFLSLVEKYGFIPNGSRVYYLNRSQPPLLALMISEYIKSTDNLDWLNQHIGTLDEELNYWLKNKTVEVNFNGVKLELAHYNVDSNTPRPESYIEDVRTCAYQVSDEKQRSCYQDLKSGAESGWDFSTRWIFDDANTHANLSNIHTRRNIPVDLNAFLQRAFVDISQLYKKLGNSEKAAEWEKHANRWKKNIELVLYNEEDGIWYDYDNEQGVSKKGFYPSNFAPLWTESYDKSKREILGERATDYFNRENVTQYQGGIPASLIHSGEQWDLPNAWPPLQDIVVLGLYKTKAPVAKELAEDLGSRWVRANLKGFSDTGEMFEKYDAEHFGQYGGGGEYVVQSGFGWTNGVVLSFIEQFFTSSSKNC